MKPGTKWLIAIVGLLAINMIAAIILIIVANGDDRSTVLPAYHLEAK
ncbi:MAG TPA: hypothetical protein VM513_18005 [Kofleriaceae bacterium]|nr:hypothetical protein [Kofleriaceae bacterium]